MKHTVKVILLVFLSVMVIYGAMPCSASSADSTTEPARSAADAAAILRDIVFGKTDKTAVEAARILAGLQEYSLEICTDEGGDLPAGLDEMVNGTHSAGEVISIAVRVMPGYRFVEWHSSGGGDFADPQNSQTQFTMPAEDVVITACFEPADLHNLEICTDEGGDLPAGLDEMVNGTHSAGEVISIAARAMPGYRFVEWRSSGGGDFADAQSSQTQFTMPAEDVVITAVFEPSDL